ncbi:hypothetical protein [Leptolyngbya sp. 7M]|uniref:hypothetical protein n=1 Tax=Leptolyngbya sp. 7M TaxID=2812896 RepID=UPI001B8C3070|nr:hypothetical protein [Leptolyngbya sp. 7M]QYO64223.1 hypothetical protein JVX88_31565 [Leptolyngbya sp. 7M]
MSESSYAELENCHIVTNDGMFLPPPTGVQLAEVVQLEIDQVGNQVGQPLN